MLVIDRFEGDWVVIEYDENVMFNLPRRLLPDTAKEGDVIQIDIQVDIDATKARRERIKRLLRFNK